METIKVKKISTKLMVGDVRKHEEDYLYSVVGKVTGTKTGTSTYGPWLSFKGEFRAWNAKHIVESNIIFLPEILTIPLEVALENRQENDSISFGVEILKIKTDSTVGYEYQVRNIIPVKESNMLEDMTTKFNEFKNKETVKKSKK